jgi:glycosyltransferase involved in cell wall biosynthesis
MRKAHDPTEQLARFTQEPRFDPETVLARDDAWPRITIVTPTLNQGQYIERTILSVLNQNYPNLEYIILDGGSRDGTAEIVSKYTRYLSHWRSQRDGGQAAALREGFERASGDILAWINSDDVYLPSVLSQIGTIMKEHPATDVCYGNMYLLDPRGQVIAERRLTGCSPRLLSLGMRHGGFGVYQPAAFWRRILYERVGEIDSSLHFDMDNDLFIRFALHRARFRFHPVPIVGFRIHEASKTFALQDRSKSEIPMLITRYGLDHASIKAGCMRAFVRSYRIWKYLLQGDAPYLARRLWPNRWNWVS